MGAAQQTLRKRRRRLLWGIPGATFLARQLWRRSHLWWDVREKRPLVASEDDGAEDDEAERDNDQQHDSVVAVADWVANYLEHWRPPQSRSAPIFITRYCGPEACPSRTWPSVIDGLLRLRGCDCLIEQCKHRRVAPVIVDEHERTRRRNHFGDVFGKVVRVLGSTAHL